MKIFPFLLSFCLVLLYGESIAQQNALKVKSIEEAINMTL